MGLFKNPINIAMSGLVGALSALAFVAPSCGKIPTSAGASDGTSYSVKTADGSVVGTMSFADWPSLAVRFSDSSIGMFQVSDGKFSNGLCKTSKCNNYPGGSTGSMVTWMNFINMRTDLTYCMYSSSDCTGTCYVTDAPIAGSLFLGKTGFYVGTGSETSTSITTGSLYRHDLSSCVVTSNAITGLYPVTTAHSMPSTVPSYPFGVLTFP
ncbi:MAG: hypothetical protein ACXVBW_13085 [Bdellovibrionota bacterium]